MRETTFSFSIKRIPLTPVAVLPIGRTWSSLKRTTLPASENNIISLCPSVRSTPISSLPSFRFTAMIPLALGREYCVNSVFFTVPLVVAIKTYLPASNSCIGRIAVIRSPSSRGRILTIGRPLAFRLASGN